MRNCSHARRFSCVRVHALCVPLRSLIALTFAIVVSACAGACRASQGELAIPLSLSVTFDAEITDSFSGRVYVMLSTRDRGEPRFGPSWEHPEPFFALDVVEWKPGSPLIFDDHAIGFPTQLSALEPGSYRAQAVMRINRDSPNIGTGSGTAFSSISDLTVVPNEDTAVSLHIDQVVQERPFRETKRLQEIVVRSTLLSEFHNRDVFLRAAVLLPKSVEESDPSRFPALYFIPGFGTGHEMMAQFWLHRMPDTGYNERICRIFLDALCYTGHHVFADSEVNGPYGRALVEELVPAIEERFPVVSAPTARFLTGISSGGWSSLWLQITYPDDFGGVWSFAPDPVDFRAFQLINLYEPNASMYVDADGAPIPIMHREGNVAIWYRDFASMERVIGEGGQLSSFEAVFSHADDNGHAQRLFDRDTGSVHPDVAKSWLRYDIRAILERNWDALCPKLKGKINVFVGEDDNFYLAEAVRLLKKSLEQLGSDAVIEIVPGRDHGSIMHMDGMLKRVDEEVIEAFKSQHSSTPATPQPTEP